MVVLSDFYCQYDRKPVCVSVCKHMQICMCAKYVYFHMYKCTGVHICICMHICEYVWGSSVVYVFVSIQINHIQAKARFYFMTE